MYFNQNKYRVNYINQKNNFNQIFTREGNVFSEQIDGMCEVELWGKRSVHMVREHCWGGNEFKGSFERKKIRENE